MTRDRASYYARHKVAEREFLSHAEAETGQGVSPEEYERRLMDRDLVRRQSDEIVDRIEQAGVYMRRDLGFEVAKFYIHSQHLLLLPKFRNLILVPYVAAMVRAKKLAALEFFLQRNRWCRFWTFTIGARRNLDELRDAISYLNRKLSRLNAYLKNRFGVEFVFRSDEFGTLEFDSYGNRLADEEAGHVDFDPATGEPLFHVHAHVVVYSPGGYIPKKRWGEMVDAVHDFWKHHWDADGVIRDARECCKYLTKPRDLLKLSPEQLARYMKAIYRMKLCHPMGTLAKEIKARGSKRVLRRYRKPGGGSEWREVGNHNEHAPVSVEEREAADNIADAERFSSETAAAARVEMPEPVVSEVTTSWNDESKPVREEITAPFLGAPVREIDRTKDFCQVLARSSPSVGPMGVKESCVTLAFTRFDLKKVMDHPLVSRLWSQTVQAWEVGISDRRLKSGLLPEPEAKTSFRGSMAERAPAHRAAAAPRPAGAQREGSPPSGAGEGAWGLQERQESAFARVMQSAREVDASGPIGRNTVARGARIRVHTDTPTVRRSTDDSHAEPTGDPPDSDFSTS